MTTIVIVASQTRAHRNRSSPEHCSIARQTLSAIGTGQTSIIASQAQLIHLIIKVPYFTDTKLVNSIKLSKPSRRTTTTITTKQTTITSILTLRTSHCHIIIIVVLSTPTPITHQRPKRWVTTRAVGGSRYTSQTSVRTRQTQLVRPVVEVIVSTNTLTAHVQLTQSRTVASRTSRSWSTSLAEIQTTSTLPSSHKILAYARTQESISEIAVPSRIARGASGGIGAGKAFRQASQALPIHIIIIIPLHTVANHRRPIIYSKLVRVTSRASAKRITGQTIKQTRLTSFITLEVILHTTA